MANKRPFGVSLISILITIGAILQIVAAFALFGLSSVGVVGLFGSSVILPALAAMFFGLILLIIGIIELAVAGGLWTEQKWAWLFAVIILWIDIVFDLIAGLVGAQNWGGVLMSLLVPVIVLIYLTVPEVKKDFE